MLADYRYQQRGDTFELRTYCIGGDLSGLRYDKTVGRVQDVPQWVYDIGQMACVAGANLTDPPDIVTWFRAKDQDLIEFKFFRSQCVE